MADYTKITDFAVKDSLLTGNPLKLITGTAHDNEYNAIATAIASKGDKSATLAQFAATTSSQLAGVISDETGSGSLVFATSPSLTTPNIGTPSAGTLTNCIGLPQSGTVGLTTADSPQFTGINVGHASDTTLTRASSGVLAVEGVNVLTTATGAALAGSASQTFSVATATTANHAINAGFSSPISGELGGNVALNNTANYFTGPSIAQGTSGTWFVSGTVTVRDTAGAAGFHARLTDGTTVIASTQADSAAANATESITLSGYISSPAGNLRIEVKDVTSTNGLILSNATSNALDSRITAFKIGV